MIPTITVVDENSKMVTQIDPQQEIGGTAGTSSMAAADQRREEVSYLVGHLQLCNIDQKKTSEEYKYFESNRTSSCFFNIACILHSELFFSLLAFHCLVVGVQHYGFLVVVVFFVTSHSSLHAFNFVIHLPHSFLCPLPFLGSVPFNWFLQCPYSPALMEEFRT